MLARSRAPFIHILFNAADIISRRRGRIDITAKKDSQTGDSPPTCVLLKNWIKLWKAGLMYEQQAAPKNVNRVAS